MKKNNKFFKIESKATAQSGLSLIEVIVAIGIFSLSVYVVPTLIQFSSASARSSKLFAQAIALETMIVSALQNPETFVNNGQDFRATLARGEHPENMSLKFEQREIVRLGSASFYSIDGAPCAGFDQQGCALKVEADIQCQLFSEVSQCFAAYRISSDAEVTGMPAFRTIGSMGSGSFIPGVDYFFPIQNELYLRTANLNSNSLGCDPETTIGVSGFNRDTGELYCIEKPLSPQDDCAIGSIGKYLKFVPNQNHRGGFLTFECRPMQTATCPANYVLNEIYLNSLEENQSKRGTCVFVGKTQVQWPQTVVGTNSAVGTCPQNYNALEVSCQLGAWNDQPVQCPTCDLGNWVTTESTTPRVCSPDGLVCSGGETTSETHWHAVPAGGETFTPEHRGCNVLAAGQSGSGTVDVSQSQRSCTCGQTVTPATSVQVNLNGQCRLTIPEIVGVL